MRDYIEIKKDLVPYRFNILLGGGWFELGIGYNKTADMYTVSLYKDAQLVATEPLILNAPLFQDVYQPGDFPALTLVPYGADADAVTQASLGATVFLTIDDEAK